MLIEGELLTYEDCVHIEGVVTVGLEHCKQVYGSVPPSAERVAARILSVARAWRADAVQRNASPRSSGTNGTSPGGDPGTVADMTTAEAARALGISERGVRQLFDRRKLPSRMCGRQRRYPTDVVTELATERTQRCQHG